MHAINTLQEQLYFSYIVTAMHCYVTKHTKNWWHKIRINTCYLAQLL